MLENNDFENLKTIIQNATLVDEPQLLQLLPHILEKIGDHKNSDSAKAIGEMIISKMNPHAMKLYMDIIYESFGSMKWVIKKAALILLGSFAKHQQKVVQYNLPNMILRLIDMASDVKKDVTAQTRVCFEELCSVIDNVDIIKIIPSVINAYMEPVKYTEEALDTLVATSFINEVDITNRVY